MLFGATNVDISTNCSKLLTYDGSMPAKIKLGIGGEEVTLYITYLFKMRTLNLLQFYQTMCLVNIF